MNKHKLHFIFLTLFTLLTSAAMGAKILPALNPVQAETTRWATTSQILPSTVANAASASYQSGSTGFVYSIGGQTSGGGKINSVFYAQVDASGDLKTTWNTSAHNFPLSVTGASAAVYSQGSAVYLYVVGGRNGSNSASTTVYYAQINPLTGDVGAWTAGTNTLSQGLLSPAVGIYQSATTPYLYVVAGQTNGFSVANSTYYAPLDPATGDVGAWTTSAHNLPHAMDKMAFATYQSGTTAYLYVVGGTDESTVQNTVYYTTLNVASGEIAAWSTSATTLPTALYSPGIALDTTAAAPTLYVMGGKNGSNVHQASVYYATINPLTGDVNTFATSDNVLPQTIFNPGSAVFQASASSYLYLLGGYDLNSNELSLVHYAKTTALLTGNIQVDYTSPIRTLDTDTFGLVETAYNLGNYLTNDVLMQTRIRALKVKTMRMGLKYAVSGDPTSAIECEALGCDHTILGDTWINAIKGVGADPMVIVPYNASDAANLVKHFNVDTNNHVSDWLVWNEPNNQGVSAASYSAQFNIISSAMKAIDPTIKVGGPTISFLDKTFMQTFLNNSGNVVDFIDYHQYEEGATPEPDATQMADTVTFENNINIIRNMLLTTVPTRASSIPISIGEWYLNYAPGDTNIYKNINSVWTASVLGHIINAGGLSYPYGTKDNFLFSANNLTYGTSLDDPMPAYLGYGMFTGVSLFPSFGSTLVSANTSLPNIEVYASDNSKNLVIVNKDPTSQQIANISFGGLTTGTAEIWRKDQGMGAFAYPIDLGSTNITNGAMSYTIPPYSVTTLVISGPSSPAPSSNSSSDTSSSSSSNGSGEPDVNFPPGWAYHIDFGPHYIGQQNFIYGQGDAHTAGTFVNTTQSSNDVAVHISTLNTWQMIFQLMPFPWMNKINTVSEVYDFQGLSAFNGYPIPQFDLPATIILPYNPALLNGRAVPNLKIFQYVAEKKRWQALTSPIVIDYVHQKLATTVKNFRPFVVGYWR